MTDKKPADMVVALRQVSSSFGKPMAEWPKWFMDQNIKAGEQSWKDLLNQAADELEQMQKLNGRLYKTLYPD